MPGHGLGMGTHRSPKPTALRVGRVFRVANDALIARTPFPFRVSRWRADNLKFCSFRATSFLGAEYIGFTGPLININLHIMQEISVLEEAAIRGSVRLLGIDDDDYKIPFSHGAEWAIEYCNLVVRRVLLRYEPKGVANSIMADCSEIISSEIPELNE